MKKSVVGIVASEAKAEMLVQALHQHGVASDDISVLFPDHKNSQHFAHENNTKAPEGAVTGASTGGLLGGGLGLLAGVGALAIPGIGPLIAAGPLMAALSGAAAGAAVGGLTGGMIGLGIPEREARVYEGKVSNGHVLIAAHVEDDAQKKHVTALFEEYGATDVTVNAEMSAPRKSKEARAIR